MKPFHPKVSSLCSSHFRKRSRDEVPKWYPTWSTRTVPNTKLMPMATPRAVMLYEKLEAYKREKNGIGSQGSHWTSFLVYLRRSIAFATRTPHRIGSKRPWSNVSPIRKKAPSYSERRLYACVKDTRCWDTPFSCSIFLPRFSESRKMSLRTADETYVTLLSTPCLCSATFAFVTIETYLNV